MVAVAVLDFLPFFSEAMGGAEAEGSADLGTGSVDLALDSAGFEDVCSLVLGFCGVSALASCFFSASTFSAAEEVAAEAGVSAATFAFLDFFPLSDLTFAAGFSGPEPDVSAELSAPDRPFAEAATRSSSACLVSSE